MIASVPEGSIYIWCYIEGLKHSDLNDVIFELNKAGKHIRDKDIQNYWNGWYNSDLYIKGRRSILDMDLFPRSANTFYEMEYSEYPIHPYIGLPEVANRWVPCNKDNKPIIKWSKGCLSEFDARCYLDCEYIAENLKGCKHIAIDIDGDHDEDNIDTDVIQFGNRLAEMTLAMIKPNNLSMHILFEVDHVIPTMHFARAHIDIIGNKKNSLRYQKNKVSNNKDMIPMNDFIWKSIVNYIKTKENR